MCPIYKKKAKEEIANYRPITLLNTDYKIFTKALSVKLTETVAEIIHTDQAGFMRNRSILDQMQLVSLMIEYAESAGEDGAIVALDQEKAYDKVSHRYLWRILDAFGYPPEFINTIKALYGDAKTSVMINGEASEPYRITRGVRQGDPISCLLFNLAIEPLAEMLRSSDLQGFNIPGVIERIITSLFADDTTVYLSRNDNFADLTRILERWCKASTAKFNVEKTEVLPIGSAQYREEVAETRKLNDRQEAFPPNIHVVRDGEPMRSLGVWIGNSVQQIAVWSKVTEKVNDALERWEKGGPTMTGRRHIANMVVGQTTQYLAMVQGMPPAIEKAIDRMARGMFWEHKKPLIAADTIHDDLEKGGAKLLDLSARNEAIDIEWVRRYLTLEEDPTWTRVLYAICQMHILSRDRNKCHADSFVSTLLQVVDANRQAMPRVSKRTMAAIRKHNVRFDPVNPSREIKESMPIWHHIFIPLTKKPMYNTERCLCLRRNHSVMTVRDAIRIADEILNSPRHATRPRCGCVGCKTARHKGCVNPNGCAHAARTLLGKLPPKWDPRVEFRTHHKLSDAEKQKNTEAQEKGKSMIFDPEAEQETTYRDCFRIFGIPNNQDPIEVTGTSRENAPYTTIYICENQRRSGDIGPTREDDVQTGIGIWTEASNLTNRGIRISRKTPGSGVITGMIDVVRAAAPETNLELVINSPQIVKALTTNLKAMENSGWSGFPNRDITTALVAKLRKRCGRTAIRTPTQGELGADRAKSLAKDAARRTQCDPKPIWHDPNEVRGAKLRAVTQKLAYKEIRSAKAPATREQAKPQLTKTRLAAKRMDKAETAPSNEKIWRSLKNRTSRKKVNQFKYRVMHDSLKCGAFWEHIPGYEDRVHCKYCSTPTEKVVESAAHILTECEAPGRSIIWDTVKAICKKRKIKWRGARLGMILASDLARFKDENNKPRRGDTRLYKIMMAEGMYLTWLIRNERVIQHEGDASKHPSEEAIRNRFMAVLKRRSEIDHTLTNGKKFRKRALDKTLVRDTWIDVLEGEPPPQSNTSQARVFSG